MSVIVSSTWVGDWELYTVPVIGSSRGVCDCVPQCVGDCEFHTMPVIVSSTWIGDWEFYTVSVTGSSRGVGDWEFHAVSVIVSSTRCR